MKDKLKVNIDITMCTKEQESTEDSVSPCIMSHKT